MRRVIPMLAVGAVIVAGLVSLPATARTGVAARPKFAVVDLGALVPGGSSAATAINASGQVTGEAQARADADENHAFLWQNHVMKDLGVPPGRNDTEAYAISDAGVVVGVASDEHHQDAFVYQHNTMTNLPKLSTGPAAALGINRTGQIVGLAQDPSGAIRPVMWYKRRVTMLPILPGRAGDSGSTGINAKGVTVGFSEDVDLELPSHAFRLFHSQVADLGLGAANAVNKVGAAVGYRLTSENDARAVLWQPGQEARDLGTLGGTASTANAINNKGWIVGFARSLDDEDRAFLWIDGSIMDLNSLIIPNSGWVLGYAQGLNDQGNIVGSGLHNGQARAFLLLPVS